MSAHIVLAIHYQLNTWRDWKGDLVPSFSSDDPILRASIPLELNSEAALLGYLDISREELKKIWWFREHMYHQFEISKNSKRERKRTISAPNTRLKYLQRRIAPLLNQVYRVRNPVHGFVHRKSVKTNAQAHLHKRFMINIDIKDFFPSISEKRVVGVLESLGINSGVSSIVARICCYRGYLPQGAPTSPILSNMICFRLDRELLTLARDTRCIYTRYADDITFSSHQPMTSMFEGPIPPPGHFSPNLLTVFLQSRFVANGFEINTDKLHYSNRHSRRMVTGLKVNEIINVDRRYIRNIRSALYSVETLGLEAAEDKYRNNYGGTSELRVHLEGKISWLRYIRGQVDPVFRGIAVRFNNIFPDHKIAVKPTAHEIRDRSVWVVEHYEGEMAQGSTFFLKDVGLVTAAHCVEDAGEVEVYHPSKASNKFKAIVIKRDTDRDLALLQHTIPATEYLELEYSPHVSGVGDEMIAVGYPSFGAGDGVNIREGKVSSLPVKHSIRLIEVTQKLSQGMSGGPLLDGSGTVVGIIHKGGPNEGRDFAIHVDVLKSWLKN